METPAPLTIESEKFSKKNLIKKNHMKLKQIMKIIFLKYLTTKV